MCTGTPPALGIVMAGTLLAHSIKQRKYRRSVGGNNLIILSKGYLEFFIECSRCPSGLTMSDSQKFLISPEKQLLLHVSPLAVISGGGGLCNRLFCLLKIGVYYYFCLSIIPSFKYFPFLCLYQIVLVLSGYERINCFWRLNILDITWSLHCIPLRLSWTNSNRNENILLLPTPNTHLPPHPPSCL